MKIEYTLKIEMTTSLEKNITKIVNKQKSKTKKLKLISLFLKITKLILKLMKTITTILILCIFSLFMQSCKSAANHPEFDDSGISLSEEHSKMDDKVEPFYEVEYDQDLRKDQYQDQDDERRNE